MEPNEYELMTNEQLAKYLDPKQGNTYNPMPNGMDNTESTHIAIRAEIARRLRTITALQAKIDGMIKRPKVEVYEMTHPGGGTCYQPVINKYLVGELTAYPDNAKREAMHLALALGVSYDMTLTTALGMDDAKEGGEG